jgi:hypothetical protein
MGRRWRELFEPVIARNEQHHRRLIGRAHMLTTALPEAIVMAEIF